MREASFVKRNLDRWEEFENHLRNPHQTNPDRLSELFIQITDDLAYSKTHYPKSRTTVYLNGLASKVHHGIYRNKREDTNRFKAFWFFEVPEVMYRCRKFVLYALITFVVSGLLGVLSVQNDDTFARLILGDGYVNMTLNNMEEGDPMAVYKDMPSFLMFLMIAFNNVKVSFFAFAAGILFSVGTFFVLFRNGIMVGVFQYFFVKYGLGFYSFLSIWVHGTLEISAIVIAGGAGYMMGHRLLFPGTYSRKVAVVQGAKDGAKVILGLVPVFIMAAILESYATRHTEWPDAVQLGIIVLSALFIVWYFFWYPHQLYHARKTSH